MKTKTIIRFAEVARRTARSRSEIYNLIRQGKFPRSVKLGPHAVGWIEDEIDGYIDSQVAARDSEPPPTPPTPPSDV